VRRTIAIIYIIISAFLWGVSFPLVKSALYRVSPLELFFLRFLFSAVLVLPFLDRRVINKAFIILGFLNSAAFLIEFVGQKYTTATEAALITIAILPLVAIISFTIGEKLNFKKSLAAILTIAGAVIIITRLDLKNLSFSSVKGNILVFIATFLWAVFTVLSRKIQKEGMEKTSWMVIFWTGIFALPSAAFTKINISLYSVSVAIVLAVFCTILAFYLFLEAMKVIDATTAEIIITLQLVFALIPSIIFLGEKLTLPIILGSILTISSILLVAKEEG